MGFNRMGNRGTHRDASIGDLIICVDASHIPVQNKKFVALVLDMSLSIYRIQVLKTGEERHWPKTAAYLWKETK